MSPIRDGFYWLRLPVGWSRVPMIVSVRGGYVEYMGGEEQSALAEIPEGSEWRGPIENPFNHCRHCGQPLPSDP